jgi:putative membrane protein
MKDSAMIKPPEKQDSGRVTTDWALERTRLAKERTFAAWLRTGLGAAIAGVGMVKLLPDVSPDWLVQAMGLLLVASGMAIFILGYRTYHSVLEKLEKEGFEGLPSRSMVILTVSFMLVAVVALIIILLD